MFKSFIFAVMCALSAGAQSQVLENTFKVGNAVIVIDTARMIESKNGALLITNSKGQIDSWPDAGGAAYAAIRASAGFDNKFVQVGAAQLYVSTKATAQLFCSGNVSTVMWALGPIGQIAADNCAFYNLVRSRAQ